MSKKFKFHNLETAPKRSKKLLKKLLASSGSNGFYSVIAESPEALNAYNTLHDLFSSTSLTNEEKTVVWQTINVEHVCNFCVPAHTFMAKAMKIDDKVTDALRDETPLPKPKLETLRNFTLTLVRKRGNASDIEITEFLKAGFTHKNIIEIVVGLAQKTVSNYVNHLAKTPVEKKYEKYTWTKNN